MGIVPIVVSACAVLGVLGQWAISAISYGRLEQRVDGVGESVERLEDDNVNQWNAINNLRDDHGQRIARIETWKDLCPLAACPLRRKDGGDHADRK